MTDLGVESLCCRVTVQDRGEDDKEKDQVQEEESESTDDSVKMASGPPLAHEDFSRDTDSLGCVGFQPGGQFGTGSRPASKHPPRV